ncbi:hypothetical protein HGO34_26695 [Agrobacterium vitis]|uniref:Uncharacterized protein n=1 Tax=Agrobacterium vitis TaxID=373 RepID=A0AAE4WGX1_AGRVI|nr:hypothetical protein [Agrobacterium vitis]MCF1501794.1 hypothetical protein [Allorhizobium sp. Av2]MCM2443296.1 hypothetical protein [Agrobacterium vitis]MUZ60942.1 hypothetical protein [Agrobacterium vitis]MVA69200.1 hypothetical protein [Agrobacterium vitis]MVA90214.1 hypothetical protein [Agrobacterium vitis]
MSTKPALESAPIAVAHDVLRHGESVAAASEAAHVSRRQLHRWFYRHLGIGVQEPNRRGFGSRLTERVVPAYFKGTAATRYPSDGVEYDLKGTARPDETDRIQD